TISRWRVNTLFWWNMATQSRCRRSEAIKKINKMKIAVVTGSAGLIGSESTKALHEAGFMVVGIDNDLRAYFFGVSTEKINFRDSPQHLSETAARRRTERLVKILQEKFVVR
ncbi:hypothetical protein N9237_00005, partial [Akkermansiaceae bacterium]|nr:hypothetical protein [Akkermansiaceae bacterium]